MSVFAIPRTVARTTHPPRRLRVVLAQAHDPGPVGMIRRLLSGSVGAVLLVAALASGASAHDALGSANPPDGGQIDVVPAQIQLVYNAPPLGVGAEVQVTGPAGDVVSVGAPQIVDTTVTQQVAPDLPAGAYRVAWRVTSADGHPISGEYTFTATVGAAAATPTATESTPTPTEAPPVPTPNATATDQAAPPTSEDDTPEPTGSSTPWVIAGAVGGIAMVAALVVLLRRLRTSST